MQIWPVHQAVDFIVTAGGQADGVCDVAPGRVRGIRVGIGETQLAFVGAACRSCSYGDACDERVVSIIIDRRRLTVLCEVDPIDVPSLQVGVRGIDAAAEKPDGRIRIASQAVRKTRESRFPNGANPGNLGGCVRAVPELLSPLHLDEGRPHD